MAKINENAKKVIMILSGVALFTSALLFAIGAPLTAIGPVVNGKTCNPPTSTNCTKNSFDGTGLGLTITGGALIGVSLLISAVCFTIAIIVYCSWSACGCDPCECTYENDCFDKFNYFNCCKHVEPQVNYVDIEANN